MTRSILQLLLGVLAPLLTLVSCQPLPPYPATGDGRLGTLQAIGPNVFRNQRHAASGEPIFEGDKLSTGAGSSAIVNLVGGGLIQLDENTDPVLERRVVNGRTCIHLSISFGRVWIDRDLVCVDTPDAGLVLQSRVHMEVGRATTVTVYRGHVEFSRPVVLLLSAGQQVSVAGRRVSPVRTLSPEQLAETVAWANQFGTPRYLYEAPDRTPPPETWCCDPAGQVSPAQQAACRRAGGVAFDSEAQARRACERVQPGWCCDPRGEVYAARAADCRGRGGRFFSERQEALQRCRPPEPVGFCCIKGDVVRMDRRSCAERSGAFHVDGNQAERVCRPPEPVGFCCVKGDVLRLDRRSCAERGGGFQTNEAQARRVCRPTDQGTAWCCGAKGQIYAAPREQCVASGGRSYAEPAQAARDRQCRLQ